MCRKFIGENSCEDKRGRWERNGSLLTDVGLNPVKDRGKQGWDRKVLYCHAVLINFLTL